MYSNKPPALGNLYMEPVTRVVRGEQMGCLIVF
jgi:hypothetical protein